MTLYITPASLSENKSDENIHRRFRNKGPQPRGALYPEPSGCRYRRLPPRL